MNEEEIVERPFRVVVARLVQKRSGSQRSDFDKASGRPARVALALALAHSIQHAIDSGEIRDQAEAARRFGITRARVTQILDLLWLAPSLQRRVVELCVETGSSVLTEHALREVLKDDEWPLQEATWARLIGQSLG